MADAESFVKNILDVVVIVILVAALFATLTDALSDYADNDTTFGPVLQTLVPILLGIAVLLYVIGRFLGRGPMA